MSCDVIKCEYIYVVTQYYQLWLPFKEKNMKFHKRINTQYYILLLRGLFWYL